MDLEDTVLIPQVETISVKDIWNGPSGQIIKEMSIALKDTSGQDLAKAFDLTKLQGMIAESNKFELGTLEWLISRPWGIGTTIMVILVLAITFLCLFYFICCKGRKRAAATTVIPMTMPAPAAPPAPVQYAVRYQATPEPEQEAVPERKRRQKRQASPEDRHRAAARLLSTPDF